MGNNKPTSSSKPATKASRSRPTSPAKDSENDPKKVTVYDDKAIRVYLEQHQDEVDLIYDVEKPEIEKWNDLYETTQKYLDWANEKTKNQTITTRDMELCAGKVSRAVAAGYKIFSNLESPIQLELAILCAKYSKIEGIMKDQNSLKQPTPTIVLSPTQPSTSRQPQQATAPIKLEGHPQTFAYQSFAEGNDAMPMIPHSSGLKFFNQSQADKVEIFRGDYLDFERFISHFNSTTHLTNADDGIKHYQLKSKLSEDVFARYSASGSDEYGEIYNELLERYRDPLKIQQACTDRMSKLRSVDNCYQVKELYEMYGKMMGCYRALIKSEANDFYLLANFFPALIEKLPRNIRHNVLQKQNANKRNVAQLIKDVQNEISLYEQEVGLLPIQRKPVFMPPRQIAQTPRHQQQQQNRNTFTPPFNPQRPRYPDTIRSPCFLCQGKHSTAYCRTISPEQAVQKLKDARRCPRCTNNHMPAPCTFGECRVCFQQGHAPAVCQKRIPQNARVNNTYHDAHQNYNYEHQFDYPELPYPPSNS